MPTVSISSDFLLQEIIYGHMHSVFSNVVNLIFTMADGEERMITLTKYPFAPTPDTISIDKQTWEKIAVCQKENSIVKIRNGVILLKDVCVDFSIDNPYDYSWGKGQICRINYNRLNRFIDIYNKYKKTNQDNGFSKLPREYGIMLNNFAQDIVNQKSIMNSFQGLLGAGIGLTPSSDDAVVGVLVVIYCAYAIGILKGEIKKYKLLTNNILRWLIKDKRKTTTEISTKYLKCACRGEFSYYPNQLAEALFIDEDKDLIKLIENVATIGHTSGKDMLEGILKAVENMVIYA